MEIRAPTKLPKSPSTQSPIDVGGQLLGEMGHAVRQWVAERRQQAGEDQHRPEGRDGHGPAAAPDPPSLQSDHEGIQDEGEKPRHHHDQDDVA